MLKQPPMIVQTFGGYFLKIFRIKKLSPGFSRALAHFFDIFAFYKRIKPCTGDSTTTVERACKTACNGRHGVCIIAEVYSLQHTFAVAFGREYAPKRCFKRIYHVARAFYIISGKLIEIGRENAFVRTVFRG